MQWQKLDDPNVSHKPNEFGRSSVESFDQKYGLPDRKTVKQAPTDKQIAKLREIANGKVAIQASYTKQIQGKEVVQTSAVKKAREATAGTQSIESIVSIKNEGVTQDNAKKILELLPTSNGLPTKKAVEMWDRILLSEKQAIQQNI